MWFLIPHFLLEMLIGMMKLFACCVCKREMNRQVQGVCVLLLLRGSSWKVGKNEPANPKRVGEK
jgi:hypothetical protein